MEKKANKRKVGGVRSIPIYIYTYGPRRIRIQQKSVILVESDQVPKNDNSSNNSNRL